MKNYSYDDKNIKYELMSNCITDVQKICKI